MGAGGAGTPDPGMGGGPTGRGGALARPAPPRPRLAVDLPPLVAPRREFVRPRPLIGVRESVSTKKFYQKSESEKTNCGFYKSQKNIKYSSSKYKCRESNRS